MEKARRSDFEFISFRFNRRTTRTYIKNTPNESALTGCIVSGCQPFLLSRAFIETELFISSNVVNIYQMALTLWTMLA